jgi:hypothetical protein
MVTTPSIWTEVLNSAGPAGLALIVMTVLLAAVFTTSAALITLLIRYILKEERVPQAVWVQECQSHAAEMASVDKLATAIEKCVWVLEQVARKVGA